MLFFRQRFCQNNNLFILCSLLLLAGFMVQIKVLYNNHQKQLRLQEYKERIDDVSETIDSVEKIANLTSNQIGKLQIVLQPNKLRLSKMKYS